MPSVCVVGSVNLDLGGMRAVRVDPAARRARVQGGATWGDLDREAQAFGLATPGGLISTTGIAGLTLAGGIGWLRGPHGLCIDNLVSADIVTADGRLLSAGAEQNPDLFWALRGGGGNFGVVTSLEFALHPVGPAVMFCAPVYPLSAGPGPIRFWRDFIADNAGSVGSICEFSTVPDGSADFAKATSLMLDLTARGMGLRSNRYSMLVKDGKVAALNVEAPGKFEVSAAATLLAQAKA